MKNRSRAYYRHHRKRIIRRRSRVYSNLYPDLPLQELASDSRLVLQPGRLSKYNLSCSCFLCKADKHFNIKKKQDLSNLLSFKEQLEELENQL